MTNCPAPDRLQRLLAEELSLPEHDAITAHVEQCSHCQKVLEQVSGSSPCEQWRGPTGYGAAADANAEAFLKGLKMQPPPAVAAPSPGARKESETTPSLNLGGSTVETASLV